jgi:predicted murein hydrolase (TIGR00659 family)
VNPLWSTPLPGILLTILTYALCLRVQRRAHDHALANPVAASIVVLVVLLKVTSLPYATYFASASFLHYLLGPATVALAIPLARELPRFKRLLWPMAAGLLAGNLSAACSAILLAKLLGASRQVTLSLAPKSVTTPIAMGISEKIGGLPSLTAVLVIATGVIGAVLGPWFLDRLHIDDPTMRGTAMGVSSHGLGTASIYQESSEAGAASGLAMGLSGLITALTLPLLARVFGLSP